MNSGRAARLVRLGLTALTAALTAFHLLLLGGRVADGSVLDPVVAGEWMVGLLLVLALLRLHFSGASLVRGRNPLILWLLILLLHAVAVAPADGGGFDIQIDADVVATVPVSVVVGIAFVHILGLSVGSRRRVGGSSVRGNIAITPEVRLSSARLLHSLVPRAPPA